MHAKMPSLALVPWATQEQVEAVSFVAAFTQVAKKV
jgi:hypothetical protein